MADEYGEKTEAPTPRRRQEAREQGQIARSQDLSAAALIVAALLLLNAFGQDLVKALRTLLAETLSLKTPGAGPAAALPALEEMVRSLGQVARAAAPFLLGLMLVVVAVNLMQVGLHLNLKRLQPNLGALNPFKGVARMFGRGRSPVQGLMAVLKLVLIAAVAYSALHGRLELIVSAQGLSHLQVFALGAQVVYAIALRVGIALLVLALIDYAWQKWRTERDLKMTKQEVKEEMRRMEGDPKIKQRRRQIAMQIAGQRMKKEVPTADVVVTNPTEFAVALKYDAASMHAPRVVAKGRGLIAQRIREIAIAAGVPILERKPLARALFKLVEVGQEIPEQFYTAVAEILAYVYELSGKAKPRQSA
jgi:flagellar biosynthetic protein FlhB